MANEKKINIVKRLKEDFEQNEVCFIADYAGLNVESITNLRTDLKANEAYLIVAKNRLIKIALNDLERDPLDDYLTGPTALVFSKENPVPPAKVIDKFIRELEKPKIKGIVINQEVLPVEYFSTLATLPPRKQLEANFVNVLASPIINFVYLSHNLLKSLVVVLDQIANKQN